MANYQKFKRIRVKIPTPSIEGMNRFAAPNIDPASIKLVSTKPKPTTKAERRKIYAKARRAHSKVNPAINTNNRIDTLQERMEDLFNQRTGALREIEALKQRVDNFMEGINTRLDNMTRGFAVQQKLIDSMGLKVAIHNRRIQDHEQDNHMKHVLSNKDASTVYEIENVLRTAITTLEELRVKTS